MNKKQRNINFGAAILFLIFSMLFFVLFFRFFYIQSSGEVKGHVLAAKAEQLYSDTTKIEAKRGTIYDRNGEVLAEDRTSYSLVAILDKKMTTDNDHPNHVVNIEMTAKELAKFIPLDESKIYQILKDGKEKKRFQVEFGSAGRDVSYNTKLEIEKQKLPGITFTRSMKRFYPNGIFASHLIGYTKKVTNKENETETIGKIGVEKSLNSVLTGKDGSVNFKSDLWGYLLPNGEEKITPARNGDNVYLTIDSKIQILLEDSMNKVDKKYKPQKIIAIVANAKNGEILAMAQRPTFHPETRKGIEKGWYNEAIETPFEPGSTMKIFTLAAAVEEGVFNPNELYQSGRYVVDPKSKPVPDHNGGQGWGLIPYIEGVQRSSNVAFAKLAKEKLGFETYRKYITKFGLDRLTGIDLPNEALGKLAFTYPIEKATTAFGQGTTITPIQQVQGATSITNNGSMMRTHVIDKIVDSNSGKIIKQSKPEVVGKPISKETAIKTRDYLETVVTSKNGTGQKYAIEGYDIAGKTGTAQIPGNGGYLFGRNNYIFSFIGMAPKNDPELIIYVAVQQPQLPYTKVGSDPVSEIFKPVMKSSLQYMQVEPKVKTKHKPTSLPDLVGLSKDQASKKLKDIGMEPIIIGNGTTVKRQLPTKHETLLAGEKVIIQTDGKLTAPDMTGWSIRDVMKVAEIAKMKLNSVGNGYVVKQNVKKGSKLKEGDYLIVEFKEPNDIATDSSGQKKKTNGESINQTDEIETVD